MITKEICDENKCPMVPSNCPMFFLTPDDAHPVISRNAIWFSPRPYEAESAIHWSHDADFPVQVLGARRSMRKLIAAVAEVGWLTADPNLISFNADGKPLRIMASEEDVKMAAKNEMSAYAWRKWANDPDEEDEDEDDENMPIVFKEDGK